MPKFLSKTLEGLVQSDIRRMTRECERVGGINLGQGICDLPTPPMVAQAARDAIDQQQSTYSYPEGVVELRDAIAKKLERDNNISASAESEVVVTVGATGAFASTLHALLNPGDGILIMEPYYGYHLNIARIAGLEPHFLPLAPPDFTITEEKVLAALKPTTRAMVVCTPSNPSGKMFTESELKILAKVAADKDLLVISDEIYEYIRYDGRPHISPASVDNLWERSVSIMGLSKTFSITGWRLGYAVAPAAMAQAITLVNDLYYICAPTPLQHGAAAGFAAPKSYFDSLQTTYQAKRDKFCDALSASGLTPIVPQGAYYVLADVSHLGYATSREASMALLTEVGVASVPGASFFQGDAGEGLIRFCFAKDDEAIDEACKRVRAFGG
jgi:aminotransferase